MFINIYSIALFFLFSLTSVSSLSLPQRPGMISPREFPVRASRPRQVYIAEEEVQGRYIPTRTFDPSSIKRRHADDVNFDHYEEDEDENEDLILQLSHKNKRGVIPKVVEL
ncbi:uncharacterized protein L199_003316 [Kwoniella botswanensis]|uniref:uncharacterized protein n=1 Tax=Kwoniella botswanensis TaxID=1268659 RepID=UPI00315CC4EB